MQDRVTLPQWLDNLIFEQLGAKYCRSNADMTVIDWDKNDVLNYLGTYFPRSYAESYCIFSDFFKKYPERFSNKMELSVFDFGCGTGGEIFGLVDALSNYFPEIKQVRIIALDGNQHALRLLERVKENYNTVSKTSIILRIVPLRIDDFYDLTTAKRILRQDFDIIMTFKAICEFVTKEKFERHNAYAHIVSEFIPKLKDDGIMLLVDVTTYSNVSKEWLPKMMDTGLEESGCSLLQKNESYNQPFYVTHNIMKCDISKIAWRLIQKPL